MDERLYEIFHLCVSPAGGKIKVYPYAKTIFPYNPEIFARKALSIIDINDPSPADVIVLAHKDLKTLNEGHLLLPTEEKVVLIQEKDDFCLLNRKAKDILYNTYPHVREYGILPDLKIPRWIIPLGRPSVTSASLDIYQPSLFIPRLFKKCIQLFLRFNISGYLPLNKLFIFSKKESSWIHNHFKATLSNPSIYLSLFTGTAGYYRKVTFQIMDEKGKILAYARFAETSQTRKLIENEAQNLLNLSKIGIRTAHIPEILFFQKKDNHSLLVQSACPKPFWMNNFSVSSYHVNFLKELYTKTLSYNPLPLRQLDCFNAVKTMIEGSFPTLSPQMKEKLTRGMESIRDYVPKVLCLSHGDFTPWNTSINGRKFYVFDWEYANQELPLMDVIHFIMQYSILVRNMEPHKLHDILFDTLLRFSKNLELVMDKNEIRNIFIYYLLKMISMQLAPMAAGQIEKDQRTMRAWDRLLNILLQEHNVEKKVIQNI